MTTPNTASIFDATHPPSRELVDDCVHCGFCLPACPTYVLWGEEADSPRGRIYLMRAGLEGRAAWSERYQRHFDTCLGCMACLTACPSGVQYDRLIEATRPQVERHVRRSFADRAFRGMIFALFPYPSRLRAVGWVLWLYQALGLRALVHASGLLRILPARLAAMERLLPRISPAALRHRAPTHVPAHGTVRRRVGLLLGCVQRVFFPHVNDATARVLSADGCDVQIPRGQGCCGALMLHAGREAEAAAAARRLIDAFESSGVDCIAINAAGCGSAMKSYGELLRDDPAYADRARAFAAKCVDVSELLADLGPQATRHPIAMRVAYHGACHLQHAQKISQAPRDVLRTIPGPRPARNPGVGYLLRVGRHLQHARAGDCGDPARPEGRARADDVGGRGRIQQPGLSHADRIRTRHRRTVHSDLHLVELLDASIRGKRRVPGSESRSGRTGA